MIYQIHEKLGQQKILHFRFLHPLSIYKRLKQYFDKITSLCSFPQRIITTSYNHTLTSPILICNQTVRLLTCCRPRLQLRSTSQQHLFLIDIKTRTVKQAQKYNHLALNPYIANKPSPEKYLLLFGLEKNNPLRWRKF